MIAIIGGGPAGLALARHLDKLHMDYDLFEEREIGATWRAAPPGLRVLSPWWTNVIDLRDAITHNPFKKSDARNYADYLLRISALLQGNLYLKCKVQGIHNLTDSRWSVTTCKGEKGPYHNVVVATGYFFNPDIPDIETDDSVPLIHSAHISDYSMLESLRSPQDPVVLVGRRVTAGQLLLELDDRNIETKLSVRSPIEYRRHGWVASLRETAYFIFEELQSKLIPEKRQNSYPAMDGGRTRDLIESGKVKVLPPISSIQKGLLHFVESPPEKASAIILATGYQPDLGFLLGKVSMDRLGVPQHTNLESNDLPGIYFLGFDNLRSHRSRYLRGIRDDARYLARLLYRKHCQ